MLVVAAPLVGVLVHRRELLQMVGFLLLLAFALTAFGIVVASRMERMESFQMVMALVLQPMIFLSGAIFPLQNLPGWLAPAVPSQPGHLRRRPRAPHAARLGRRARRSTTTSCPIWADIAIVLGLAIAFLAVATWLFGHVD